jgi:hypothetical protein
MDFAGVVSTAALVNNAIDSIKNARELLATTSEPLLRDQMNVAYDSLLDLKGRLLDQDEEIRALKAQLADRAKYGGPFAPYGFYYPESDEAKEHPLCPNCFQKSSKQVSFLKDGDPWWSCPVCPFKIRDKNR